ncbi:sensor histidine kinase [Aeromonas cavernicola]|uniref:histidine kinase n=1 Tax=Aeromonas cavernicola TaxID=1006623 RepID=A0A2H9U0L6_9GAMM|nr:sensor histidine kinase [Aeromonas cavernicola]PJG57553.1 histidine kinase [Aeromonas cavernicola]
MLILWGASAWYSYYGALAAATAAYDRTLLASARTVAERLTVSEGSLKVDVPYVVLDSFERNMRDRLFYQVRDIQGAVISGFADLPPMPLGTPLTDRYPALAYFYDGVYQDAPIRAVVLLQPVGEGGVNGMAKITVAETLLSRQQLAEQLLCSALQTQGALVVLTLLLAYLLLKGVLRPMRRLSREILRRDGADLAPLPDLLPWQETRPLVQAFNRQLARLRQLVARQERFSADAAHQLRTPLTILKTQVEVARTSADPSLIAESLGAMAVRLDHTIALTERLLLLAQLNADERSGLRQRAPLELVTLVQQACLSRLTQARSKEIDLGYEGADPAVMVAGESLLLGELCANLLDNAIKYTPSGGIVTARVLRAEGQVWLEVEDSGPGIAPEQAERVWQPFLRLEHGADQPGAGLGLALVRDIAHYHHGEVSLLAAPQLGGLLVRLSLPLEPHPRR